MTFKLESNFLLLPKVTKKGSYHRSVISFLPLYVFYVFLHDHYFKASLRSYSETKKNTNLQHKIICYINAIIKINQLSLTKIQCSKSRQSFSGFTEMSTFYHFWSWKKKMWELVNNTHTVEWKLQNKNNTHNFITTKIPFIKFFIEWTRTRRNLGPRRH